jgi:cation transport ATPase
VIFVGVDARLAGFVAIADPIKGTTAQALEALKVAGIGGMLLSPVVAAAAMALSSVSVIGNALRLRSAG